LSSSDSSCEGICEVMSLVLQDRLLVDPLSITWSSTGKRWPDLRLEQPPKALRNGAGSKPNYIVISSIEGMQGVKSEFCLGVVDPATTPTATSPRTNASKRFLHYPLAHHDFFKPFSSSQHTQLVEILSLWQFTTHVSPYRHVCSQVHTIHQYATAATPNGTPTRSPIRRIEMTR
jgi:hypothetical protein